MAVRPQRRKVEMKKTKKTKKDWLAQLPNEVLSEIVSLLPLKEAVRTSVLSRDWKLVWTGHSNLCFDAITVLGLNQNEEEEEYLQSQNWKFLERVDRFLILRDNGPKIDSILVHFPLTSDHSSHIRGWVNWALSKGVERIDFDFSAINPKPSSPLEIDWRVLSEKSNLKHLKLGSCSFSNTHLGFCSCSSLISLVLEDVCVSNQQLQDLLLNCSILEKLSLRRCDAIESVKLSGLMSSRMKVLEIQNCLRLRNVDVCGAENLVTFEYTGSFIGLSFKNVPKLTEALLNFTSMRTEGVTYALTRFPGCIPKLETLNIFSTLVMQELKLPEIEQPFTNVKELVLTITPFLDDDNLSWIAYILKAFPLLQKLQLNLFSPNYVKRRETEPERQLRLSECQHKHLIEVELSGFYGNRHEVELLKYLLDNLAALKVLVVSRYQKRYRKLHEYTYEESSLCSDVYRWLPPVVPSTVKLQINN